MAKSLRLLSILLVFSGMMSFSFAQDTLVSKDVQNKNVLIEDFMGYKCPNCPGMLNLCNSLLEEYPGKVNVISVHWGSFATPPADSDIPDLRTDDGGELQQAFNITTQPTGYVNRGDKQYGSSDLTKMRSAVENELASTAYVNIAADGVMDWSTRELTVRVQLYYTSDAPVQANYISIAALQENIEGDFLYCNEYDHVLREYVTDLWGDEVTTVQKGTFVEKVYKKKISERIANVDFELNDISCLAFVSEGKTNVANSCQVSIRHENKPRYRFDFRSLSLLESLSCDTAVDVRLNLYPRFDEAFDSLSFICLTDAGQFEYTEKAEKDGDEVSFVLSNIPIKDYNREDTVRIQVTKVDEQDYDYFTERYFEIGVLKTMIFSPSQAISVEIIQDRYGSEITWEFSDGENIQKGGPYADLDKDGVQKNVEKFVLSSGCNYLKILDEGKNGINSGFGSGRIYIKDSLSSTFYSNDGKYGASLLIPMRVLYDVSDEPEEPVDTLANFSAEEAESVLLYPNPANHSVNIDFGNISEEGVSAYVIRLDGKKILDIGTSASLGTRRVVPLDDISAGIYFVVVETPRGRIVKKLVVVK